MFFVIFKNKTPIINFKAGNTHYLNFYTLLKR